MKHKRISRYLLAAGAAAGTGAGLVFLVYLIGVIDWACTATSQADLLIACLAVLGMCVLAAFYGLALREYMCICRRIGQNRSFCPENARGLQHIFRYLLAAAATWLAGEGAALLPGMSGGPWSIALLLFAMASAAMGILAYALGQLLCRATQLQEENELTI